jgi:hypothetical protein
MPRMNTPPPLPESSDIYRNFFSYFVGNFKTQGARLDMARKLAAGTAPAPSRVQNPTRLLLAAHWGHSEPPLRRLAYSLYEQKDRLDAADGQRVLVVVEGSADKALADPKLLLQDLVLVQGRIPEEVAPVYQFSGNPEDTGQPSRKVCPPYLNFGVELPLEDTTHIAVGVGGAEVVEAYDAEQVLLYAGTLSIGGDQAVYNKTFMAGRRSLFIGDAACAEFFKELGERTYVSDIARELFAAA